MVKGLTASSGFKTTIIPTAIREDTGKKGNQGRLHVAKGKLAYVRFLFRHASEILAIVNICVRNLS
jgi:hypothetical protein